MINLQNSIHNPQNYINDKQQQEVVENKSKITPAEQTQTDYIKQENRKEIVTEKDHLVDYQLKERPELQHNDILNNPYTVDLLGNRDKIQENNDIVRTEGLESIQSQNIEKEAYNLQIENNYKRISDVANNIEKINDDVKNIQYQEQTVDIISSDINKIFNKTDISVNEEQKIEAEVNENIQKTPEEIIVELKEYLSPRVLNFLNINDSDISYKVEELDRIHDKLTNKVEEKKDDLVEQKEDKKEEGQKYIATQYNDSVDKQKFVFDNDKTMTFVTNMMSVHSDMVQQKIFDLLR